jgi:hypothetical protein
MICSWWVGLDPPLGKGVQRTGNLSAEFVIEPGKNNGCFEKIVVITVFS